MKTILVAAAAALLAAATPLLAQAPAGTPPKDMSVQPPVFSLQSLWNEIDCECECPCCERIKQLIKQRMKNPDSRPMPAPDERWRGRDRRRRAGDLPDVSDDQSREIRYRHRLELIDLRAELEKRQLELDHLMHSRDVDEKELRKRVDAVARARADLEFKKLSARLELRRRQARDGSGGDGR